MKKEYLKRKSYTPDLTDNQWKEIEFLFVGMREYKYSKRELVNAVLYLVGNGCKWRNLPPYSTVHSFYRRARLNGMWDMTLIQSLLTALLIPRQFKQYMPVKK